MAPRSAAVNETGLTLRRAETCSLAVAKRCDGYAKGETDDGRTLVPSALFQARARRANFRLCQFSSMLFGAEVHDAVSH